MAPFCKLIYRTTLVVSKISIIITHSGSLQEHLTRQIFWAAESPDSCPMHLMQLKH